MMITPLQVSGRFVAPGHPAYIVAELSANHNQDFEQAVKLIHAAQEAGADAVKLQTYTSDTMTIQSHQEYFRVKGGTLWDGKSLYDLYGEAYTPWEWQPKLKKIADEIGLDLFSTPFDKTAVDFLEAMGVPAYKIASFEVIDLPLVEYIASKKKPIIMSTGMATLSEIEEAVQAMRRAGGAQTPLALLKCTSAYPAPPEEMHLRTIPHLAQAFHVVSGLSDHTLGMAVSVAAVALGACIIEKHFTLSRSVPGPDSAFSLEPAEFKAMVNAIRTVEKALGEVHYEVNTEEKKSRAFRRSLFAVQNILKGEVFTEENIRSIRPGYGLPPKYLNVVVGKHAARSIERGTPLSWDLVGA